MFCVSVNNPLYNPLCVVTNYIRVMSAAFCFGIVCYLLIYCRNNSVISVVLIVANQYVKTPKNTAYGHLYGHQYTAGHFGRLITTVIYS